LVSKDKLWKMLEKFIEDEKNQKKMIFDKKLTGEERQTVHVLANVMGLNHGSSGNKKIDMCGSKRFVWIILKMKNG